METVKKYRKRRGKKLNFRLATDREVEEFSKAAILHTNGNLSALVKRAVTAFIKNEGQRDAAAS